MDHTDPNVRVPMIEESAAEGRVAELYEQIRQSTALPFVPDMFRMLSTRPSFLEAVVTGYKAMFLEGTLPRPTRELIAAWASRMNECTYCVGTHNSFFRAFGGQSEVSEAVESAATADDLPVDERTTILLHLVTKLTHEAYKITDADWEKARDAGWNDEELFEAFFVGSMFSFINRLVDGMGLGTSVTASRVSQHEVPSGGQA